MRLDLISRYVALCKEFNKPITWSGLRQFKKAFK